MTVVCMTQLGKKHAGTPKCGINRQPFLRSYHTALSSTTEIPTKKLCTCTDLLLFLFFSPKVLSSMIWPPYAATKHDKTKTKKATDAVRGYCWYSVTYFSALHACSSAQELATEQQPSYCPMLLYVTRQ